MVSKEITQLSVDEKVRLNRHVKAGTFGESISARNTSLGRGVHRVLGSWSYNGEKNFGEMGPAKDYNINYETLRVRSWQLYLESEIAQTVLDKYTTWVIGKGLKLQCEPAKMILESYGIKLDTERFCDIVEGRFELYKKSRMSDYSNMSNLNKIESESHKNCNVGGDMLVILRVIKGIVKVQVIDGVHVVSPMWGDETMPQTLANGNTICEGIELSPEGEHVAYHVRKPGDFYSYETERIPARGARSGVLMAYMIYGKRYRLDNHRGLPLLSVVFESTKKLERYKEAMVASAEERAKIVYAIEHDAFSDGTNPMAQAAARAYNADAKEDFPQDTYGNELANRVQATTNKQTYNLGLGMHLKALESKNEMYFKEFYQTNIELFCAAAQIPPEVALSKYDSNFSASRAALKDWENTLLVRRADFAFQFLQPIYELFLIIDVLNGVIDVPGLREALLEDNKMICAAYFNTRFAGTPVPHIDPKKEVDAERAKLGPAGAHIPLTTVEAATEALNGGESDSNMEQFAEELEMAKKLAIKMPEVQPKKVGPGQGSQA